MKVADDQQGNECIICHDGNGTLISAHNNKISHMYHLGCLALAHYQSPLHGTCPACTNPLTLPSEHQKFIDSPATVFLYGCKNGMIKMVADVLQEHSLQSFVIQTGFTCGTYGNHADIIKMLFDKGYLAEESAITCLSIGIQQKNINMVKLWYKFCSDKDLAFDWRIISEDNSIEIFDFLVGKLDKRYFCSFKVLMKALRSGNSELAQKLIEKSKSYNFIDRIQYYWMDSDRMRIYGKVCEASLWGDLASLKIMKCRGFFLHVRGDLACIIAHFLGHSDVEYYLKSQGCKLETTSLFYKLAEACATNNFECLMRNIGQWHLTGHYKLEDVVLKLMLLLSIKNENILMLEFILSKCGFLSVGTMDIFEYAVELQKHQIVQVFLKKFSTLSYFAIIRASYFNNQRLVEQVSHALHSLRKDSQQAAFLKVYQFGIIHQNTRMISFAANELNLTM